MADQREQVQVQPILDRLQPEAEAWPLDWASGANTVSFICRRGAVLTRTADAARVRQALIDLFAGFGDAQDPQVTELTGPADLASVSWQPSADPDRRSQYAVAAVLRELDRRLAPRVARPDHVLYLCGHPCPAGEPDVQAVGTPVTSAFDVPPCPPGHGGDGSGRTLYLVDTGVDAATVAMHPWLKDVVGDPDSGVVGGVIAKYGGHGTFSAGCARVTAPGCDVVVAEALPSGIAADYESNVVAAIDRLLDQGTPDVLLVCFASASDNDDGLLGFEDLYRRRLQQLTETALLAPAGNDSWSTPMFPAAYPWFTSVGALDAQCADRAGYSNYGWWVDVWAPGTDLVNAFPPGTYTCDEPPNAGQVRQFTGMARWSGTSFATPLVAGMVLSRAQADRISGAAAMRALLADACWPSGPQEGPRLIP